MEHEKNERNVKILNIAMQSIVFGVVFTLLGQYVGMIEKAAYLSTIGVPFEPSLSALSFSVIKFWLPAAIGALIGFCIVYFIPVIKWGVGLAFKLKAKPGSLWFSVIVAFVIAAIMVLILSVLMSILTTVILVDPAAGEHALTLGLAILGGLKYLYLFFPIAWLLAVIIANPSEKLARLILKVPEPKLEYGQH
ncbi:hypothetical protein [Acetobacterium wieringae]|uniref:Uncharacterized protein n=1 Tax=Acetobacterium wieringae TaxID=52694 RepID=A0A5D0WHB3_9FIRM|nr:hypothetical protein [Acetobacterium wieringae]MEA4806759.1 hypothetical protein [Acetobacterium wieringae]TYC83635.1 hypothetical protein FXB42_15385 [Acetobacterium wieringae]